MWISSAFQHKPAMNSDAGLKHFMGQSTLVLMDLTSQELVKGTRIGSRSFFTGFKQGQHKTLKCLWINLKTGGNLNITMGASITSLKLSPDVFERDSFAENKFTH